MQLFDSHTHLQDDRLWDNHKEIISRAIDAGVAVMVCCGCCERDWERVHALALKYPQIIPAFGIHPWNLSDRSQQWYYRLEELLLEMPYAAVGEIGLDHAIENRNDNEQQMVFLEQLQLAERLNRPVSIHCRKAWFDLNQSIQKIKKLSFGGVIHAYSGSAEMLKQLTASGLSISISGSITYERNRKAYNAVVNVPLNNLLIESDAPDIVPCKRTGYNEPAFIIDTVIAIASHKKKSVEEIADITYSNGQRIFGCRNIL